jgi:hypothetical protein
VWPPSQLADAEVARAWHLTETFRPMARSTLAALREFRLKYKVAYEAYQSCVQANAALKGHKPPADLLERETAALRRLSETRADLLAAMAEG